VIKLSSCPKERYFYNTSGLSNQRYHIWVCPLYRNNVSNFSRNSGTEYQYYDREFNPTSETLTKSEVDLYNLFRMLWEQHGAWTRMTIMSLVFDLPDVDVVTDRLLQNPIDFGNALMPFYGENIASKFSDLLKSHLVIAAQLVKAAKAGDNKSAATIEQKWYANADEIAALLASINPYWPEEEWKRMLHEHLGLVKAEAVSMLTKSYENGIEVYDELENQALEMADFMAEGIIKQFPDRFIE
jgi:hypothetical protein